MQLNLPLISTMQKAPKRAPDVVLRQVITEAQAVDVSILQCGKAAFVAASLGMSPAYLSMIRHGRRPIPEQHRENFIRAFCLVTGSLLLRQFIDLQSALIIAADRQTEHQKNLRLAAQLRAA